MMTRREWLQLAALCGGALLSGCSRAMRDVLPQPENAAPFEHSAPIGKAEPIKRLLERTTFGARPSDIARVAQIGAAAYIDEQLAANCDEDNVLKLRLRGVEIFQMDAVEMRDSPETEVLRQLQQAAILRAVYSRNQLRERLVEFWSDHFNVYALKDPNVYFTARDQENVVRRHALGHFPEMLRASARSAAMLQYLDNTRNRRGVPNENYARELMELHTLGVNGGYTQRDVQEVARCFTGWTVEDRFLRRRGSWRFDDSAHDDGAKTVLGVHFLSGGGERDALRVLDILAAHPATARHISGKLCRYFLGEENAAWTRELARIYLATKGDIKAMLRPLLLSNELVSAPPIMKRPFDFLASSLRATNADTDGNAALQKHLSDMGQALYLWPMPDGYPNRSASWTGSLLPRWNFAAALCCNEINGTTLDFLRFANDQKPLRALAETLWAQKIDAPTMRRISAAHRVLEVANNAENWSRTDCSQSGALLLCAPEFQWR